MIWLLANRWALAAAGLAIALCGAGMTGWHYGAAHVRAQWALARAQRDATDAKALAAEIKSAAATGLQIASVLRDAAAAIPATRERTRVIVREVSHAVDADPNLAARLPADVVRLRREQSDESARIAAESRRGAGK